MQFLPQDDVSRGKTVKEEDDTSSSWRSWLRMRPAVEEDVSGIDPAVGGDDDDEDSTSNDSTYGEQCCQMANFYPFLTLDFAGLEGRVRNPRIKRGQILQRSIAEPYSFKPEGPNTYNLKIQQ